MLGVNLCEFLSSTIVFIITIHHFVRHLPGTNPVYFKHLKICESVTQDNKLKLAYLK